MAELIEPRLLKGFRDFLPEDERERLRIVQLLGKTFASFGFDPIDTPILEYTDILLGKGGGETDKQVYRFTDQGGRDVAMRFDLTVPFARFMAQHLHQLPLPFKRYHISKVFRGENTQRGRYREFIQCDFDIVGSDTASADFEVMLMMDRSFRAMGIDNVRVHFSHRGIFNSLLQTLGVADKSVDVLRTVDKLRKIGEDEVRRQLVEIVGEDAASTILTFVTSNKDNDTTLASMADLAPESGPEVSRLRAVLDAAARVGIGERLIVDPSITRGLDYYTGIVFETFLTDLPEIGSVCSGGRYDNLAGIYSKEHLPGVGASIGLDRLMAALDELGILNRASPGADALVICTNAGSTGDYHAVADRLREHGLRVDVFPEEKKLPQQYAHAEKKSIRTAVFVPDGWEPGSDTITVRNLATRSDTTELSVNDAALLITSIAAAGSAPS